MLGVILVTGVVVIVGVELEGDATTTGDVVDLLF